MTTLNPSPSESTLNLDHLEALVGAVPEHLQLKGWFVAAPSFGHQHVYADDFEGQGRQHIASLPAHKTYFSGLAAFIAAFDPATVKHLIALARRDPGTPGAPQTAAACDVLAERQRQVSVEDWTHEHDDAHPCGEIAAFAALYAMPGAARDWPATETGYGDTFGAALCPEGWQPKFGDRRRELVKAGAMVLAEIERLDRAAASRGGM